MNPVCDKCPRLIICKKEKTACTALEALYKIGQEQDQEAKVALIRDYARQVGVFDCEVSPELQKLGKAVITGMQELSYIPGYDIRVGYVLSYESKKKDGKTIAADCRKVTGPYKAYLPFDFIVTFYWPNMSYMTDNQKKVLMLHELKHVGIGPKGLRIEPHDIEEFETIITRYGLRWNGFGNDVPDILAGGENGKEKRTKSDRMATGRKAKKSR